jgi:hypothetical protein
VLATQYQSRERDQNDKLEIQLAEKKVRIYGYCGREKVVNEKISMRPKN